MNFVVVNRIFTGQRSFRHDGSLMKYKFQFIFLIPQAKILMEKLRGTEDALNSRAVVNVAICGVLAQPRFTAQFPRPEWNQGCRRKFPTRHKNTLSEMKENRQ